MADLNPWIAEWNRAKKEEPEKLDVPYFEKNLKIILRDINLYTPDEMARALQRLSDAAKPTEEK